MHLKGERQFLFLPRNSHVAALLFFIVEETYLGRRHLSTHCYQTTICCCFVLWFLIKVKWTMRTASDRTRSEIVNGGRGCPFSCYCSWLPPIFIFIHEAVNPSISDPASNKLIVRRQRTIKYLWYHPWLTPIVLKHLPSFLRRQRCWATAPYCKEAKLALPSTRRLYSFLISFRKQGCHRGCHSRVSLMNNQILKA